MRVLLQVLPPGVQDGENADLSAESFGVGCHLQCRCGTRREQQVIESTRIFEREHIQFMRDAEDNVEVGGRQYFSLASGEPACSFDTATPAETRGASMFGQRRSAAQPRE